MEGYRAAIGPRRTRRHVSVGVLLAHALLALTACTGAAEPAATPDTLPSVSTTAAAGVATDLSFPFPKNIAHLNRVLPPVMTRFGANAMSATRIFGYASIAWYDTISPPGTTPFLAPRTTGQSEEQGMLAAGAVIVELLGNPVVAELVEEWDGDLTEESAEVVAAVLEFAASDGFDAAEGTVAPVFEGDMAWKAGGSRDAAPGGYEPGYGSVKPVRLDLDVCPVPVPDRSALAAEKASITGLDVEVPSAVIIRPERFGLLIFIYLEERLPDERLEDLLTISQVGNILLHDSLIATWRANWANGIASPLDLVVDGDTLLMSSYPSYPSWTEVAVSALETYLSGILDTSVTFEEIVEGAREAQRENTQYLKQLDDLTASIVINRSKEHHWAIDRTAGRDLGDCIAREYLSMAPR